MATTDFTPSVEEFQGIYGPYQVHELLLQKIWLEGSFDDRNIIDSLGRSVVVRFAGRWNRLDGPDFKDAILTIDGELVEGDVEVHFGQKDWYAHQHDSDPAYDNVVLHILYHPILAGRKSVQNSSGKQIPGVSLMERLWYDLEEYANIDSIVSSTGKGTNDVIDGLLAFDLDDRRALLYEAAKERWFAKVGFAALRVDKLGWERACHQTAMEIMGFRFNRTPMLRVAGQFDLERISTGDVGVDRLWTSVGDRWKQRGCRPANQPLSRLKQYVAWAVAVPDWPERLLRFEDRCGLEMNSISDEGERSRRELDTKGKKEWFAKTVVDEKVGGTRLDTLICDGFLPLLAAVHKREYFDIWFSWYVGDFPDSCIGGLKLLQIAGDRKRPLSNGWGQGILKKMAIDGYAGNSLAIG